MRKIRHRKYWVRIVFRYLETDSLKKFPQHINQPPELTVKVTEETHVMLHDCTETEKKNIRDRT